MIIRIISYYRSVLVSDYMNNIFAGPIEPPQSTGFDFLTIVSILIFIVGFIVAVFVTNFLISHKIKKSTRRSHSSLHTASKLHSPHGVLKFTLLLFSLFLTNALLLGQFLEDYFDRNPSQLITISLYLLAVVIVPTFISCILFGVRPKKTR